MRKILKSKRKDVDYIIIDILRGGSKPSRELKKAVFGEGVTVSTYHRHVRKLVKQGILKYEYELVKGIDVEEADKDKVLQHLSVMKKEESPDVLRFRIGRLSDDAGIKRMANLGSVLQFCEEAFQKPKYQDKGVRKELVGLCEKMIRFERFHEPEKHTTIVERIQKDILRSVIEISKTETDSGVLRAIISLFKHTDKESSVDAIFQIVERVDDELYKGLKQIIFEVLFRLNSILEHTPLAHINSNIDRLLKSTDPRIRKRGIELGNYAY